MIKKFDVIIIGGGPAGYTTSIRMSQLGFKVACIDNWNNINNESALGGTCANVGCIPSKTLLKYSQEYKNAIQNFKEYGILIDNINIDLNLMQKKKNIIIKQINQGIKYLFKKNKIHFFHGIGSFLKKKKKYLINIKNINKENKIIKAKYIILATGSKPKKLNNISFDEKLILSNIGGLSSIKKETKKICIIGAGAIGLEIGSIWNRLNIDITIFEQSSNFLSRIDKEISQKAFQILIKQKLKIILNTKIYKIKKNKNNVLIKYSDSTNYIKNKIFDKVMICVGRKANFKNLNIKNINLLINKNGFIKVNKNFETNLKNVWAIGDVIGGNMLAHKSEKEGIYVAEYIFNKNKNKKNKKLSLIPSIIYTYPEIAWVGKNEEELIKNKINYKKGIFPFIANAKARILDSTDGIIKILAEKNTKEILGIHIIGPLASELIAIATIIIDLKIKYKEISKICYAHPTLSEIIKEVILSIDKKSINF
ncbi:dihydrolipoyl dehydrogenase [Candidatus Zinderia endosymbiont of Aphrophora alni]|uniref:dihydrolipoyl dehydrogenase n=1 Tax=Candidatus Zinderia endosymbiont of Aphrophora alni TaxID=3077951 RepID=UPI0030D0FEF6